MPGNWRLEIVEQGGGDYLPRLLLLPTTTTSTKARSTAAGPEILPYYHPSANRASASSKLHSFFQNRAGKLSRGGGGASPRLGKKTEPSPQLGQKCEKKRRTRQGGSPSIVTVLPSHHFSGPGMEKAEPSQDFRKATCVPVPPFWILRFPNPGDGSAFYFRSPQLRRGPVGWRAGAGACQCALLIPFD